MKRPPSEAVAAAREGRVYLLDDHLDLWLVRGKHGDYVVVRGLYCSCPWFQARVLPGLSDRLCYHIVAVELVARGIEGRAKRLRGLNLDVENVVLEAVLDGFSRSLRLAESRAAVGSSRDQQASLQSRIASRWSLQQSYPQA
ncbi:hypothetical protein Pyrfu_0603 [Pyrolobus fumarii 1A]|uniref:SWIM-type domain-containing protein n=1 Tax=Pyrolobus fumarii (strain DSM 11204 / 1A) TaxID=694429 RepID=G0EH22_PYRF1|nr:SWIM zinc finger family protein [Pyrolobus fumarii]AEM38472.1 hypothetical protein Pyrfu_0603 [Pyrolobus fumarii 1A]